MFVLNTCELQQYASQLSTKQRQHNRRYAVHRGRRREMQLDIYDVT
jgi:hypothetical protein